MKQFHNINFLRYFYSASKQRSISKAAKENFVTQSAISQGIDKLEKELGRQLISNRKNQFELTSDGELLLDKCERIFSYFSEIEDLYNEKAAVFRGRFHFATSHSFAISLLPSHYKKLLKAHPDVEPIVRLGHAGIVRDWVSKGEIEFGIIVAKPDDFPLFQTETILEGFHGIYKPKNGAQGTLDSLDRLIISPDAREDNQLLSHLKKNGYPIPPLIEILSWEVIAQMVEQGLGMGMLPDYVAERHQFQSVAIPLPKVSYHLIAIWSKTRGLSRNARMFINFIKNQN